MKNLLKTFVRETLRIFNLKLSYYDKSKPRYIKAIANQGINLILDIGANSGQFALETLNNGFPGEIISFEPTSKIYKKLKHNSQKFTNWKIHDRVAVGEECGTIKINIASNSAASSSVLAMRKVQKMLLQMPILLVQKT